MKPPAFQFYADDFLAGTFSMSNEERGLYITLLCRQWTQGHVTLDEIARLGSTVVQPSLNHVLTKFQPDEGGNLKNARLEVERAKQSAFRALQSEKGKASAQARFNRGSTVVQPRGEPKVNSPSPSPSPDSSTTKPKESPVAQSLPLPFDSLEFAQAWGIWKKHRTEIRKPLTPTSESAQLAELLAMGETRAIKCIQHTIAKGWQGLREGEGTTLAQRTPKYQAYDAARATEGMTAEEIGTF